MGKKMNLNLNVTLYTNIKSKLMMDFNVKNCKIFRKTQRKYSESRKIALRLNTKSTMHNLKIDKSHLIKTKICFVKEHVSMIKTKNKP